MIQKLRLAVLVLTTAAVWTIPTTTWAQGEDLLAKIAKESAGTLFTKALHQTADGRQESCGFEFRIIAIDRVSGGEAKPVMVDGSFAFRKFAQNQLGIAYKVGTAQISSLNTKAPFQAPAHVWFRFGNFLVQPLRRIEAQTTGYALYIAQFPEKISELAEGILNQSPAQVGFNSVRGSLDVVADLDLSTRDTKFDGGKVERLRDPRLGPDVIRCLAELMDVQTK